MSILNCDVLLLAAGYGKRLLPLTASTPKPLLPVGGRPLIDYNLEMISRSGGKRAIINLHHLGNQIERYVGDGSKWGLEVEYSKEPVLLDTGGAIKNIENRLTTDNLIVMNSDILVGPEFSLRDIFDQHTKDRRSPVITAALRADSMADEFGSVDLSEDGIVCGFLGKQYRRTAAITRLMYLGVQVLSKRALTVMPKAGSVFSITQDTWRVLLEREEIIVGFRYNGYWNDVGTPDRMEQASKDIDKVFGVS